MSNKVVRRADSIQTTQVENYVMPNTKISNLLTENKVVTNDNAELDNIFNTQLNIETINNKYSQITTSCLISFDEDDIQIDKSKPYTEFDRAVYNAVTSHFVAGNTTFTAGMICRAMTGNAVTKPSPQQVGAVTRSLYKMNGMRIKLDASNEFIKRELLGPDDKWIREEHLLMYTKDSISIKGNKVDAYHMLKEPILYSYAHMVNQLITVPIHVLNTPSDNTEKTINMKNYLIRRIEGMRNNKNSLNSNLILLSNLYDITNSSVKVECARVRKQVEVILNYWVDESFISNYEYIKQKNKFHALKITL